MRRMVQWVVKMASLLFTKIRARRRNVNGTSLSARLTAQTAESSAAVTPPVLKEQTLKSPVVPLAGGREQYDTLFDTIMKDIGGRKRRMFRHRAKPVGFTGPNVLFDAEKNIRVGARIIRSDGRVYKICGVKKAPRHRVESAPLAAGGGR